MISFIYIHSPLVHTCTYVREEERRRRYMYIFKWETTAVNRFIVLRVTTNRVHPENLDYLLKHVNREIKLTYMYEGCSLCTTLNTFQSKTLVKSFLYFNFIKCNTLNPTLLQHFEGLSENRFSNFNPVVCGRYCYPKIFLRVMVF